MPKKYFTRVSREFREKEQPWFLHPFRYIMTHPVYFSVNRRSICRAVWIGVFCAFLPIPFQMVVAGLAALAARVNLPVAVAGVWITNPFTMGPLFYLCYKLGATLLGVPIEPWPEEVSFAAFGSELSDVWKITLYGGLFMGLSCATLAYIAVNAVWRVSTASRYKLRREQRSNKIER